MFCTFYVSYLSADCNVLELNIDILPSFVPNRFLLSDACYSQMSISCHCRQLSFTSVMLRYPPADIFKSFAAVTLLAVMTRPSPDIMLMFVLAFIELF